MTPKEKELVEFLKLVDRETYTQSGQRFWEASNKLVTEEELAYYYLNAPDSPYNQPKKQNP
jgi:hypothetical protein